MNTISKFFILFLLITSCNNYIIKKKIEVNSDADCFNFINAEGDTLYINRKNIEVIENTINDTILIGYTILPPGKLGKIKYSKTEDNLSLNLKYKNPPTKEICYSYYRNKPAKGALILKLTVVEKNTKEK